jgi:GntR family transcriptional regulator
VLELQHGTAEVVADRLVADIEAAGAADGGRLPSERRLAATYGVSRDTVRRALKVLQERGLAVPSSTRGWFVIREPSSGRGPSGYGSREATPRRSVRGFADYAASLSLRAESRVLSTEVRLATLAEADLMRIAPGAPVFDMVRLRLLDGLLVAHEHNRLPLRLCPELAHADFDQESLYAVLRRASPPQVPVRADYSVTAQVPTPERRRLLDLDEDSAVPLLVATQLSFNQEDRPLEYTVAAYRSDRYLFTASISS